MATFTATIVRTEEYLYEIEAESLMEAEAKAEAYRTEFMDGNSYSNSLGSQTLGQELVRVRPGSYIEQG